MERPARIGRLVLVLLGTITAAAGIALWITEGVSLGLALGAFGAVLIALGTIQHFLYRREQFHWPDQAHLWSDGIELVLHNGEVRGASWSDPDFALQLVARRVSPPAAREYLLIWLMDSRVPPVELSADGFDQLRQVAVDRGLQVSQGRRGSRSDSTQWIEMRQPPTHAISVGTQTSKMSGPD